MFKIMHVRKTKFLQYVMLKVRFVLSQYNMRAVPSMAVFCTSLTSCSAGMMLSYLLTDSEVLPVAPSMAGITFAITFHMRCVPIVYIRIFSTYLLPYFCLLKLNLLTYTFVFHYHGLLLWMVLCVRTC
jgi:hypothetical protein